MVSLQSALLPEARRPPCVPLVVDAVVASTATSKKRKRDAAGDVDDRVDGAGVDGIELNFDAAPLPPEWQRCLDIKSGQIHYYNTRTHKRTSRDPRAEAATAPAPELHRAAAPEADEEEEAANCAPPLGLDLELNLTFEPRRVIVQPEKKQREAAAAAKKTAAEAAFEVPGGAGAASREMVAGVCARCHMLVMMCRAWPACPNCKFLHPTMTTRGSPPPEPEPVPLKLGLQLLCCKD